MFVLLDLAYIHSRGNAQPINMKTSVPTYHAKAPFADMGGQGSHTQLAPPRLWTDLTDS